MLPFHNVLLSRDESCHWHLLKVIVVFISYEQWLVMLMCEGEKQIYNEKVLQSCLKK